jgi:cytidine deaminase
MDTAALIKKAWEVRDRAYAPFSGFSVGAALEDEAGRVFVGCNVENISFGLTICAERAAVCAAVAAGSRRFRGVVIVSDSKEPVSPCGACRQVLAEFAPELSILCENKEGLRFTASLSELLPRSKAGILDKTGAIGCST